jgi:hypothetical protein
MTFAVECPIGTEHSVPYGSATREGSEESKLAEFDYVEEEFFVSGTANTYGPAPMRPLADDEDLYARAALHRVRARRAVHDASGRGAASRRRPILGIGAGHPLPQPRGRRAVRPVPPGAATRIGVEVCSGTRFGADETPSGGVPNLHRVDPHRYESLVVAGGKPEHWPGLTPGALGRAFETLDFGRGGGDAMKVFRQELYRSYASGPDIYLDIVLHCGWTVAASPMARCDAVHDRRAGCVGDPAPARGVPPRPLHAT